MMLGCLAVFWLVCLPGWAGDFSLESAGARYGFGSGNSAQDFHQVDAAVKWDLPWQWNVGTNWLLQTHLQTSVGWLGESDEHGAIASVGPSLSFSRKRFPVSLEVGFEPSLLSHTEYSTKNFGQHVQFISFAGLNWDIGSRFRLGYRFQHMSNASLSRSNPGLNMSLIGLFYRF